MAVTNLESLTLSADLITGASATIGTGLVQAVGALSGTSTQAGGTSIPAYGLAALSLTSNYAAYFNLASVAVGQVMDLVAMNATTGYNIVVKLASGQTFVNATGTNNTLTFDAAGDMVELAAVSATKIAILSNEGSVALSTTT